MSENQLFKVEEKGHIAWLTLNRPEKRNIMGLVFFKELSEHFKRFDEDGIWSGTWRWRRRYP